MEIKASINYLKITARKVRQVADLIRNKPVIEAEGILAFTAKKACKPLLKLLKSAEANANQSAKIDAKDLRIERILVNDGPMQERVFPRSRGRADKIKKRTSHVTIQLGRIERKEAVKKEAKPKRAAKETSISKS